MANATDLAKAAGIPRAVVDDLLNQIIRLLQKGEPVKLTGFGTFERKLHRGRTLKTPAVQDGAPITYPDSFAIRFRQSPIAKQRINTPPKKAKKKAGKKTAKKATKKVAKKAAKKQRRA